MTGAPLPPGSLGWPWLGEGIGFLRGQFEFFETRFRRHGHIFKTRIFGNQVICLVGPEGFEVVNDPARVTREHANPGFIERLMGVESIPFVDNPTHRRRRSFLLHGFEPDVIAACEPVVTHVFERYLDRWLRADEVVAVDELDRASFVIATALFFGGDPDLDDDRLRATFARFNGGLGALPVALPFTAYGKALAARDQLWERARAVIAGHQPGDDGPVLDALVRAQRAAGEPDDQIVAVEIVHAFAVGQAALAAGLVAVTRTLGEHRTLMQRARDAARTGNRSFLHQLTRECRRFHRIVPITGLSRIEHEFEHGGYRFPLGWRVVAAIHATMHDETHIERPEVIDPDRFAGGCPAGYVAHGGGPPTGHRCAGESLADLVLASYLEVVLPDHDWQLPEQNLEPRGRGFAPKPADGLRTRFLAL